MHGIVIGYPAVNFIGVYNKAVFLCDLSNLNKNLAFINRSGRVIRIDNHNGFGFGADLLSEYR